jgi:heat-inducible transcriptional repressor
VLEEYGYLEHLHTSGGRIPSDLGYRYFVTHLLGDVRLPSSEQIAILQQFRQIERHLDEWIEIAAVTLAQAAGNVSLVSAPLAPEPRLRHVEMLALQPKLGMILIVTTDGAVRQVMVHWDIEVEQPRLSAVADQFAQSLRGLSASEIASLQLGVDPITKVALEQIVSGMETLTASGGRAVKHSGLEHALGQPEFRSPEEARGLLGFLDSGALLASVLPHLNAAGDVQIFIGAEIQTGDVSRLGLVLSTYGIADDRIGVVGVLGPTRMDYDRSISSVRYVAQLMSSLMAALHSP